ncbi:MAG: efflux RND transporter periplasmic adaptor subunit, partial [Deltaproteobacteria bacterium]|nr:efflux RND transporter periplasmic adaptor subunit [Deltaproteobacteria bacterium]
MKKLSIWILVVVALIGSAVLLVSYFHGGENTKQGYKTALVNRGQILAIVTSTGTVNPLNTVKVGSQISGNIIEIYVDFNSVVKKDQVIARIDPAVYEAQLEQARAQRLMAQMQLMERQKDIVAAQAGIESAVANLNSAKATLREAELQYNRIAKLRDKITVSQSRLDEVLARRDNARGAVEVAKAKVETSKAQLQRAQAQEKGVRALIAERKAALKLADVKLKYCTIKSPIDGEVIERAVDVGQTVAATLQSPVLFTIAENLARMQVEVDVSEADVGQIKPDQDVEFTVDAFPEKKFRAKVRQVRNFATEIQNVVTYKVIADVNNDSFLLRPGMTANVTITVAKVDNVLKVPNAALRFKPPGEIREAKSRKRPPTKETD